MLGAVHAAMRGALLVMLAPPTALALVRHVHPFDGPAAQEKPRDCWPWSNPLPVPARCVRYAPARCEGDLPLRAVVGRGAKMEVVGHRDRAASSALLRVRVDLAALSAYQLLADNAPKPDIIRLNAICR